MDSHLGISRPCLVLRRGEIGLWDAVLDKGLDDPTVWLD